MTSIPVILRRRRRISVGPTGPTNTVAPVVSGTATVGQTLSTTNGTWSGVGTITYAYQWLDDGATIPGATSSTYTLTAGEEGGFISCRVTATDDNGSTAATSNSLGPVAAATGAPLDLDFATGTYVDNASNTLLSDIATFSRSGNATMVDSDGLVKWAPHNMVLYSEQLDNGVWTTSGVTVTANAGTDPDGGSTADRVQGTAGFKSLFDEFAVTAGVSYTVACWVKRFGATNQSFALFGDDNDVSADLTATDTWQLFTHTFTAKATDNAVACGITDDAATSNYDVLAWGMHIYRSDLGGMVDNPERGDSYVPTTSAAVYMPRENHYEWNGSSWANTGLLLETDAATNLNPNSADTTTLTRFNGVFSGTTSGPDNVAGSAARYIPANNGYIYKVLGGTSGRCASFYIKPDATNLWAWVGVYNGSSAYAAYGVFNLSTGAVVSTGGASFVAASIEPAANGFFRCAVSISSTTNAAFACTGLPTSTPTFNGAGQPLYTADGGGCYIFGGQLEAGDYPSSYIPTSGATATRAGETLSVNAAGVPWSTTAMSWVFEGEASWVDSGSTAEAILFGSYVDASNNLNLAISGSGADTGKLLATTETATTVETADGPSNTAAGYRNAVSAGLRHTTTDLQAVDGGTSGTNQTAVGGSIYDYGTNTKALYIGGDNNAWAYNGTISRLRMWDSDIGASELETETT